MQTKATCLGDNKGSKLELEMVNFYKICEKIASKEKVTNVK